MSANANGAQDTEAIQQSTIADGSASIAPADIQWQAPEPGIGADRHQNHCYQEHEAMSLALKDCGALKSHVVPLY